VYDVPAQQPHVASSAAVPVASSPPVEHDDPSTCVDPPEPPPAEGKPKGKGHKSADAVPSTFGRLPAETIQAIVRANYDRVRACYEPGLARDPKLAGRVGIRFVIGRDGKVASTRIADCTLPDCSVAQCVRDEFKALTFPEPEGGIVTVVYPLMLEPG
jgi:outer membrane biosynthesis protein TonB